MRIIHLEAGFKLGLLGLIKVIRTVVLLKYIILIIIPNMIGLSILMIIPKLLLSGLEVKHMESVKRGPKYWQIKQM